MVTCSNPKFDLGAAVNKLKCTGSEVNDNLHEYLIIQPVPVSCSVIIAS